MQKTRERRIPAEHLGGDWAPRRRFLLATTGSIILLGRYAFQEDGLCYICNEDPEAVDTMYICSLLLYTVYSPGNSGCSTSTMI